MHTTGSERNRITALIGISMTNEFLPLYIILKGKKIPREIQEMEADDLVVSSNTNAWMNDETFRKWIETIWRPHAARFQRSLLIMDRFRVHQKPAIVSLLAEMNTDCLFIPAGLTFFVQPCDVYVNKVLKEKIRQAWIEFIAAQIKEGETGLAFFSYY